MKKSNLLGLFFLFLSLTACERWFFPCSGYTHSLLIYMAADNSLTDLAETNMAEILNHSRLPEDHALFVYTDRKGVGAFLIRITSRNYTLRPDTLYRYGAVNSADPSVLEQVIEHTRTACPAKTYGLILWSHGTGWLPEGLYGETPKYAVAPQSVVSPFLYDIYDPAYPQTKTFGKDGNNEMEIPDLARVLKKYYHEYVCFDACLMADIQTYYDLKETARYLMGSPTEIIDTGYPYDELTNTLFPYKGERSLIALCNAYYNKYEYAEQGGYYRSATISLMRTNGIPALAQEFKKILKNNPLNPESVDRKNLQMYDRLTEHVFWDIESVATALGTAQDLISFTAALENTVVFKKATEDFITIPIKSFSGLAVYLPVSTLPRTQTAFESTSWNVFLDWIPYVE